MTDLRELLERVEKATRQDREIDIAIDKAMGVKATNDARLTEDMRRGWFESFTPRYTASIDAAVALVERVRPEPTFSLDHAGGVWTCELHRFINPSCHVRADMPTAPLAIIAALLRSLIAEQEPHP